MNPSVPESLLSSPLSADTEPSLSSAMSSCCTSARLSIGAAAWPAVTAEVPAAAGEAPSETALAAARAADEPAERALNSVGAGCDRVADTSNSSNLPIRSARRTCSGAAFRTAHKAADGMDAGEVDATSAINASPSIAAAGSVSGIAGGSVLPTVSLFAAGGADASAARDTTAVENVVTYAGAAAAMADAMSSSAAVAARSTASCAVD
mmetsp:Transcript_8258/g.24929  ORF Transcript_8258/g.24929 Transcript_8258/m.24929 type:complete len:208 (+) Transcript_8258:1631-2254(+)|eukprot:364163-Chlamydomonas_euryale.AAC.19